MKQSSYPLKNHPRLSEEPGPALHAKIGELTMENDFLSVALGRIGGPSAKK